MKKYIKLTLIAVLLIAVAALAAAGARNVLSEMQTTTTTTTQTTTQTTTAPTTAAPTTLPVTSQKQPETLIDLNSITIIDLYPLSLAGGSWDVKHCQGIAVDKKKGYIYYSYTTMFVKCDFDGNIVGTVTGFKGHLGDITYNEQDGKVYCGYNSPDKKGIYIAVFNADKIKKTGMKPTSDIVRTVFLKEPFNDHHATVKVKNKDGNVAAFKHRYGCTGIDAVAFGPDFSKKSKSELLTVAYGIILNNNRSDNKYQVLLQYDVTGWWENFAKPYSAKEFHKSGPEKPNGKYFVYTGNTNFGVQTMEYFDELNLWVLNCYKGSSPDFANYNFFAIDADVAPKTQVIKGQQTKEKGQVLSLYQDGLYDKKNDIYGWYSSYGVQGIAYMSDGLFYIVRPYTSWTGTKTAICYLSVWSPDKKDPFILAAGIGNDYSISKKPRVETTAPPSTTKPETTKPSTTKPKATKPPAQTTKPKTSTTNILQGISSLFDN